MQAVRSRVLWRRPVVLILILALVGGAAGAVVAQFAPRPYQATARVDLSTSSPSLIGDPKTAQNYSQKAAASFASVATSPLVLRRVISELGLRTTPEALADHVSARVAPDTAIIGITASDLSAARSVQLANAVGSALVVESRALIPSGSSASQSRLTMIQVASASTASREPGVIAFVGLGAALGLLIALVVLLMRSRGPRPPRGSWRLVWVPRQTGEPA